MFNKINVLQLGNTDLSNNLHIPEYVTWIFLEDLEDMTEINYDICFLSRNISYDECKILIKKIRAYTLYVLDDVGLDSNIEYILKSRKGKRISFDSIQIFLDYEAHLFYDKGYGEKYNPQYVSISPSFKGTVFFNGFTGVELEGDFGEDFYQIAYWKNNIPFFKDQILELWLEYEKEGRVEIQLKVEQFQSGSISTLQNRWIFSEEDMKESSIIENKQYDGSIFVSLLAKGKGKLTIHNLHDRYSRKQYGSFLPGGKRFVTNKREEIFVYFDPGDLKPPLNVYFSGYKTMESFEGYYMMRRFGAPFILITDNRLEGGAFYLGDEEFENQIISYIRCCLDELEFDSSQLILSGLSMGTFGALYYGCKFCPHALILGKPLASLGDMAKYERLDRPQTFPTSLDVLTKNYGDMSEDSILKLNSRFWDLFDQSDFSNTKFIISYMYEDDYDSTAYNMLISHIKDNHVEIYGKGLHGRHNDDTYGIVSWFANQYQNILDVDFNRKEDENE